MKFFGIVERGLVEPGLELVERIIVRHVGGEGDLAERLGAVGAGDRELAVLELDVGLGGLEQMGRDLPALVDHLVERLDQRRAADRQRARAVGSHAERNARGVAMHDVDILDRHAEPLGHKLREGGLVTLAVAVGAGENGDAAGRIDPHRRYFIEPGPRAERAGHRRRRHAARLDIARHAEAAQLALTARCGAALLEAGIVGVFERHIERGEIVAAVIGERDRRLVGIGGRGDEVAAAQFGAGRSSARARPGRRCARSDSSPRAGRRRDRRRPARCG